jgi:hypothetical protein
MATDKKISELPVAAGINANDVSVLVSNGVDYQFSISLLLQFLTSNLSTGAVINFGTVIPQNNTGKNGDLFVKTNSGQLIQKVSGSWTVVYTLPAANGADGAVLYGSSNPSASTGKDLDTYINTVSGIFYLKTSGTWNQVFSMQTGPQGPKGDKGDIGNAGINGKTILNGVSNPSNLIGNDGDYYMNTALWKIYGPKMAGVWGDGVVLFTENSFAVILGNPEDNIALAASLDTKVDKIAGKQLSDENFTSTEKTKLANLSEHYVGYFSTLASLQAAHPLGLPGEYATVDSGVGVDADQYVWDNTDTNWVLVTGPGNVLSVNGQVGPVSLSTDNIGEGSTNKYFTDARVATYGDTRYAQKSTTLTGYGITDAIWDASRHGNVPQTAKISVTGIIDAMGAITGSELIGQKVSVGGANSGPQLLYVSGNLPGSGLSKYYNSNNAGYSSNDFFDDTNTLQLAFGYANTGVANAFLAGLSYFLSPNKPLAFIMSGNVETMRLTGAGVSMSAPNTITRNDIRTTSTDGLILNNSTLSTSIVTQQYSPRLQFVSSAWATGTAANVTNKWFMEARAFSSSGVSSNLYLMYNTNGGSNTDMVLFEATGRIKTSAGYANIISSANGIFDLQTTGGLFTRNVNDANAAFTINQQQGTGYIQAWQFAGSSVANLGSTGILYLNGGVANIGGASLSYIQPFSTGTIISRNVADANVALMVNQVNASSTGPIQGWQFNNIGVAQVSVTGTFSGGGINNYASSSNAAVSVLTTGTNISRNIADTNTALTVNQGNASSTGNILNLQFGSASRFTVDPFGNGSFFGRVSIGQTSGGAAQLLLVNGLTTSAAFSTNGLGIQQAVATYTSTAAGGTQANAYINSYAAATLAASNATTLTKVYGNFFNPPIAGTNVTFISPALAIGTGGDVEINGSLFASNRAAFGKITVAGSVVDIDPSGYSTGNAFSSLGFGLKVSSGNTYTSTAAAGTQALGTMASFGTSTFAATNATTITNASTLYVGGSPIAGANVTLTNAWSLYVATGSSFFGGGIYAPSINASSSPNNSSIALNSTGTVISRNVADGNTALNVNNINASNTGSIQSWSFNGSVVAHIPASGTFFGAGLANLADPLNSRIQTLTTGANITRNIADANSALIVNQINASSTGDILQLQFGGVNKFSVQAGGNAFVSGRFSIGTNINGAVLGIYSGLSTSGSYGTNGFGIRQDAVTYTSTATGATIAATYVNSFANATLAASNATTLTKAYGSYFNTPLAGTNVTIGASFSAGFAGSVEVGNELYTGGRIAVGFNTVGTLGAMVHINPSTFVTSGGPSSSGFAINQQSINYTSNAVAGTPFFGVVNSFAGGVFNATNTQTINSAISVYIPGAPTAGTNTTITNAYSLYVGAGNSYFGGPIIGANSIFQTATNTYTTGNFTSLVKNSTTGRFETIANTGTGNNVLSDSPTFTGTLLGVNATLSGNVIVPAATLSTQAVNKGQIDGKLDLIGGTLTGQLNGTSATFSGMLQADLIVLPGAGFSNGTQGSVSATRISLGSLNTTSNEHRYISFYTNAVKRWDFGVPNQTEPGNNTGSNIYFTRYNDAGTYIDSPFGINRQTGVATFLKPLTIVNGVVSTDAVNKGQLDLKLDLAGGALTGTITGTNAYFSGEVGGTHVSSSYGGALTPGDASFGNVRVSAQNADRRLGVMMLRNGVEGWFMGTNATDANWNLTVDGSSPFSINRTTKVTNFLAVPSVGNSLVSVRSHVSSISALTISTLTASSEATFLALGSSQVVFTLPLVCEIGARITFISVGSGGWRVSLNTQDIIKSLGASTTLGPSGYLTSSGQYHSITLQCTGFSGSGFLYQVIAQNGTPIFN